MIDDAAAVVDRDMHARGGPDAAVKRLQPWPKLDPLTEPTNGAPKPFPFDALGPTLGGAALAISRHVQAPDALAAGSVLAAASLATMAHADVMLPHGQRAPLALFIVSAAGSGDRKTACDAVALAEIESVRREQVREYLQARQANEGATPRSLTIAKATTEGLQLVLRSQPIVGLFSGEAAELLSGHSMREERRAAGIAWLLKAWGAETLDSLTRGDGLSVLLGRRIAMHCMVQPVLLRTLLADPLAQGQGLLARCLIAEPASLAGSRLFRPAADVDPAVSAYHARVAALLARPPQTHPGGDGCELAPRLLRIEPAAARLWIEGYNDIERAQAPGGKLEGARPFASKAAEHTARIAGVLALIDDPEASSVSLAAMEGGLRVADFYLDEHVRLTGASTAEHHDTLLRTTLDWLTLRGAAVPHRDVLQLSPRPVRSLKAAGIGKLLDELAQRGYIRRAGDTWEVRRA